MNMLAAGLLLVLAEPQAFWGLHVLVSQLAPADFFTRSMVDVRTEVDVISSLLPKHNPTLANHFAKNSMVDNREFSN